MANQLVLNWPMDALFLAVATLYYTEASSHDRQVLRWRMEHLTLVAVRLYDTDTSPHGQLLCPQLADGSC